MVKNTESRLLSTLSFSFNEKAVTITFDDEITSSSLSLLHPTKPSAVVASIIKIDSFFNIDILFYNLQS
jgi:hypothetical protein